MIAVSHQPIYLPYIGNIAKIACADVFVVADNLQYSRHQWHNRNRIKDSRGSGEIMLTVPVYTKDSSRLPLNQVMIDNSTPWRKKHWKTFEIHYKRAPFFNDYADFLYNIYTQEWERLFDLNYTLLRFVLRQVRPELKILLASELGVQGRKNDYLIDVCRKTGADTYLSGQGARDYVDEAYLMAHGIGHRFHNFIHPVYPQLGKGFVPNLSAIDLLMNRGPQSKEIILAATGKDDVNR